MKEPPQDEDGRHRITEICLNIAYTDPEITAKEWMELLREKTDPEHPVRLYYMLGESVSYLSGLRDLSELFACEKKERENYQRLWEERLAPENQIPYRLAQMEYDYQTDAARVRGGKWLEDMPETAEDTPWPVRLGVMYLAYLFADGEAPQDHVRKYIREMAASLMDEESLICRWNARALYYLAEARWGEKEDLMRWIRETGGDIGNDAGKTRFYLTAEVKINMYLGNYSQAESILQTLIPYFEKNNNRRWLAEALFQRAIAERERGENGQALKTTAESLAAANPCRYVRLYTGYGKKGAELLEEYLKPGDRMLDVGSGSGILAICGIKLGASSCSACDIDPIAVRTEEENAARNGCSIHCFVSDLLSEVKMPDGKAFDIVTANIVADVIIRLAPDIGAFIRQGGYWIVSGIIEQRTAEVDAEMKKYGFTCVDCKKENGWYAGIYVKA